MKLDPQDIPAVLPRSQSRVLLHSVAAPAGSRLGRTLEQRPTPYGDLRPLVGSFTRPVVQVSGPAETLEQAAHALPEGLAKAEAVAVRLRRAGVDLEWGEPHVVPDVASFVHLERARGASSIAVIRADASLLTELQVGAFFEAYWRRRIIRRALCGVGLPRTGRWTPSILAGAAADAAFWIGVRSAASAHEWRRLARSSYVVVYYHRIAGEGKAGQERLNVHPRTFQRQLRLLQLLGFRPLSPAELLAFHSNPAVALPGRRYVLAADDAFTDAVAALRPHARLRPHVFVSTSYVGGEAWWADNEPVATWDALRELERAGGVIESHSRGHTPLPELDEQALAHELAGSLHDLESQLSARSGLLAYPHGSHDERVRAAAIEAGYRAAFTTEPGRNGAGTDVYCLRRVGLKDWDGALGVTWKALTGELMPWFWERRRRRLREATTSRRAARSPRPTARR